MAGNNDWVIIVILTSIVGYLIMLQGLQRTAAVRDFLMQHREDATNHFPSWCIISLINILLLSTLVSQYIPFVPRSIREFDFFGYELNKLGYTFAVISLFYFVKSFLSLLYYLLVGDGKIFPNMYFWVSKFYFLFSFLLIGLVFTNYYMDVDRFFFSFVVMALLGGVFIFKNIFYLLHRESMLPVKWYYKFLYICTLQLAPVFALWKSLFF